MCWSFADEDKWTENDRVWDTEFKSYNKILVKYIGNMKS